MRKSLFYRLFGCGRVPAGLRAKLVQEGIALLDEGIKGTIIYRNFRAPGKASTWKEQRFSGAVALTTVRFVAFASGKQIVNVPLDDPRLKQLQVTCEGSEHLLIVFDPALFHDNWSGTIDLHLYTPYAHQLHAALTV
jgi:hypothetical protein